MADQSAEVWREPISDFFKLTEKAPENFLISYLSPIFSLEVG